MSIKHAENVMLGNVGKSEDMMDVPIVSNGLFRPLHTQCNTDGCGVHHEKTHTLRSI